MSRVLEPQAHADAASRAVLEVWKHRSACSSDTAERAKQT